MHSVLVARAMEDYLERRTQLILEDRAQRVDAPGARILSEDELRADEIVRRIRAEEAASVWAVNSQSIFDYDPAETSPNVFPGMEFLTGKFFDVFVFTMC